MAMPGIKALAALAAAALLGRVDAWWSLHRLDAAAYPLARCLDGTPCVRLRACAHHSAAETETPRGLSDTTAGPTLHTLLPRLLTPRCVAPGSGLYYLQPGAEAAKFFITMEGGGWCTMDGGGGCSTTDACHSRSLGGRGWPRAALPF